MQPNWMIVLPSEEPEDNVYQCFGCANCCTHTGRFKPVSCTGIPITETFDN